MLLYFYNLASMKKGYYWLLGVLLLLIITNPSVKAFKDYLGKTSYINMRKENNFFVGSLYSYNGESYFAIAGNFFKITKAESKPIKKSGELPVTIVGLDSLKSIPKYKLWKALYSSNNYFHSYSYFEEEFSTTAKIDTLYNTLHSEEYYTKSHDDFVKQFFKSN